MREPKTKKNDASVLDFISKVENPTKRADSLKLVEIFSEITNHPAVMWGNSIIGFGSYHYIYASGREGDWPAVGFSPRKQNLTLYIMNGFGDFKDELKKLGPHSTGKSCLYIKTLEDIDEQILRTMIEKSYDYTMTELNQE